MIKQQIYFGDTLVYSTERTDNLYKDIVIKRAAGMVPSMTFTALNGATLPTPKSTIIRAVSVDSSQVAHEVFRGVATESTTNFYKEIEVVCEGIASRLNSVALSELKMRKTYTSESGATVYMDGTYTCDKSTVICRPTLVEQLADLENIINAQLSSDFDVDLQIRNSTAHPSWSTNKKRVKLDFERGTAMELINSIAQNAKADLLFDGNVIAFVPKDYILTASDQSISFGVNLMDLSNDVSYSNLCTTIIPYGCYYDDSDYIQAGATNPGESWHRLDMEELWGSTSFPQLVRISVPNSGSQTSGYRYAVEDSTKRSLYGRHVETVTFDDVTDYNTLYTRAVEYLNARTSQANISLSALDLSGYGDYAPYVNVNVSSTPHGLSGNMRICESEMHFGKPDEDKVTLGSGTSTITGGSSGSSAVSGFGRLQISDKVATQVTNIVRERIVEHLRLPEEVVFGYYNDGTKKFYKNFNQNTQEGQRESGYADLYTGQKDVAYIGGVPTFVSGISAVTLNRGDTFKLTRVHYGPFYDEKVVDPDNPSSYMYYSNVNPNNVVTKEYAFNIPLTSDTQNTQNYVVVIMDGAIYGSTTKLDVYAIDSYGYARTVESSEGLTFTVTGTAYTPDYTFTIWEETTEVHTAYTEINLGTAATIESRTDVYNLEGVPNTALRYVGADRPYNVKMFDPSTGWRILKPALYLYNKENDEWDSDSIDLTQYYTKSEVDALIPTATSDLLNDSGFIDNTVTNLVNYYTINQTYTKAEVEGLISSVINGRFVKVQTLPTASADTLNKIYLLSKGGTAPDVYDEYITVESSGVYSWEKIGNTSIDLTGYIKSITVNGQTYLVTTGTTDVVLPDYPTTLPASDVYSWAKQPNKPTYSYNEIQGTPTLAPVATSGDYEDLSNKPTIPTKTSDLINDSDYVSDANYVHTDSNYTSAEKNKLSGIASGAEVNVQSDWNQTDNNADDFIKNKPTIPDAQVNSDWNATSGVAKILNKPTIPDELADLTSDSTHRTVTDAEKTTWNNKSDFSGSYTDLTNKPTIPTKTSDLTNDSDYVSDGSYVHTDNNYTTAEKNKLNGIASGAEVNVQSDWNVTNTASDAYIANKPTSLPASDVYSWAKQPTKPTYDYSEITGTPTIPTDYLPLSGGTLTGDLQMLGKDLMLKTVNSSSNDSGDIAWYYGNEREKARLWTDDDYTSFKGLNYRVYKSDGTLLGNTKLATENNTLMRYNWWSYGTTHNANDLIAGIVFAYSNQSNTVTTGTLVDFSCVDNNNYRFQLQCTYNSDHLFFRRQNGDVSGGTWADWKEIVHAGNITNYCALNSVPLATAGGLGAVSGDGTHSAVKIATLTYDTQYTDGPITFEISQRDYKFSTLQLSIAGSVGAKEVIYFTTDNENPYYIYNVDGTTFELYADMDYEWGGIALHRISGYKYSSHIVTVNMEKVSSIPSGAVQCTYGGNVNYANTAGALTSYGTITSGNTQAVTGGEVYNKIRAICATMITVRQLYFCSISSNPTSDGVTFTLGNSGTDNKGAVFSIPAGFNVDITTNFTNTSNRYCQFGTCQKTATLPTVQSAGTGRGNYSTRDSNGTSTCYVEYWKDLEYYDFFFGFNGSSYGTVTIKLVPINI